MKYYVQTQCVDEGIDQWWTIAVFDEVRDAVAVAKAVEVRDSLSNEALRTAIVCDEIEMKESYVMALIDEEIAESVSNEKRGFLQSLVETGRDAVTDADIEEFLFRP